MSSIDDLQSFKTILLQRIVTSRTRFSDENILPFYPASSFTLSDYEFRMAQSTYSDFVSSNMESLFRAYASLSDQGSKLMLIEMILFRLLGHRRIRLPFKEAYEQHVQALQALVSAPSPLAEASESKLLKLFKIYYKSREITLNCLAANIFFTFIARQYYFERGDLCICPEPGDHVIDAGGCFGDTAVAFAVDVGPAGRVHTFEPMSVHLDVIAANVIANDLRDIISVHACGLSDSERDGTVDAGPADPGHMASAAVRLASIDAMVATGQIERVDFIKMDIEGAELPALEGCRNTIQEFKPKLAISAYHKFDDLFTIIDKIKSISPSYRFHLDNYTLSDGELVVYATAR